MWTSEDLVGETEWTREYATADRKSYCYKSTFLDGEVSVTLETLVPRWHTWTEAEKLDFCNSFSAAPPPNAEGIIRLLASDDSLIIRSSIANTVADQLPAEEAVALLAAWLEVASPGNLANYFQALSRTHHPRAHVVLEQYYLQLLDHPSLMEDAEWTNHVACDLVWCIENLLTIGTSPSKLARGYQALLTHPCKTNRKQVDKWLTPLFGSA